MAMQRTVPTSLTVEFLTDDGEKATREFKFGEGQFIEAMRVLINGDPIIHQSFVPGVDSPLDSYRFTNELLKNAPDTSWDRDESAESVAIAYVRYLESQVLKYRGCLEEHEYATEHEIPEYLAAGFIAKACTDLQRMYAEVTEDEANGNPQAVKYARHMADELGKNLAAFHKLMDRLTPKLDEATRDDLIADAVMNMLKSLFR